MTIRPTNQGRFDEAGVPKNPTRADQIGACILIVLAVLLPLAVLFLGGAS